MLAILQSEGEDEIEKTSWGPIIIGTSASIILLLLAYFLMAPKTTPTEGLPDKVMRFNDISLVGRENGEKIWEISAKTGWATRNNSLTVLEDVVDGTTYKDGKPVVKKIKAALAKIYDDSKKVEVFGTTEISSSGEAQQLTAEINLYRIKTSEAQNKTKEEFTKFWADYLMYDRNAKVADISGNIKLIKEQTTIRANKMTTDYKTNESLIYDKVKLSRGKQTLYCNKLYSYPDRSLLVAVGSIEGIIKGKEKARLTADKVLIYTESSAKDKMEAVGNVEVTQKNKAATSDKAYFLESKNQLVMTSNVKSVIEQAKNILKPQTVERLKSSKGKDLLYKKTYITTDKLILSTQNGNAELIGNVHVNQKDKEARSDRAIYSETQDKITMYDNVFLKEKDKWIQTNQIKVDIKREIFEAVGGVKGEVKFKR